MASATNIWAPPQFEPHPLVRGGRMQTLFPVLFRGSNPLSDTISHTVTLCDGDRVALHEDCPRNWNAGDPAVLLMHGLGGCHQSSYMQRAANKMVVQGWRVFRMDHRGSGAGANLAVRPYHAGRVDDPLDVLAFVSELCPGSPLAAVGYSLSGNLILKMSATRREDLLPQLQTVIAICPAIDLQVTCENIRHPRNRGYDKHFAKLLWSMASRYEAIGEQLPELLERKKQPLSVFTFDDEVTAPIGGFKSAQDYYTRSSSIHDLEQIELPALILAADDDPLIPAELFRDARLSDSTRLLVAKSGGHLGFIAKRGIDPDRRWMDWRIIEWIDSLL